MRGREGAPGGCYATATSSPSPPWSSSPLNASRATPSSLRLRFTRPLAGVPPRGGRAVGPASRPLHAGEDLEVHRRWQRPRRLHGGERAVFSRKGLAPLPAPPLAVAFGERPLAGPARGLGARLWRRKEKKRSSPAPPLRPRRGRRAPPHGRRPRARPVTGAARVDVGELGAGAGHGPCCGAAVQGASSARRSTRRAGRGRDRR